MSEMITRVRFISQFDEKKLSFEKSQESEMILLILHNVDNEIVFTMELDDLKKAVEKLAL